MSLNKGKRPGRGQGSSATAQAQTIRKVKRLEDQLGGELLEGIPNDIVLVNIAARLPWSAWKAASAISLDWQRAFHNGMVCDARLFSQKTETFVVVSCNFVKRCGENCECPWVEKETLSLFSPNEKRWYKMPSIPGFPTGIPLECHHAFLESSIYVLGGKRNGVLDTPSAEVFVLDLAAHPLEWRRCAHMLTPRLNFHIGVMHGKIFVFGGRYVGEIYELSNEAYDPKVDAWSWIAPLIPSVSSADTVYSVVGVYSVGQQFVCCGMMPYKSVGQMDGTKSLGGLSGDAPSKNLEGKLVIRADARGTRLVISRQGTADADDQMDSLHKIIESEFIDEGGRLRIPPFQPTPAKHLADDIERHEAQLRQPLLWAYDPVEDEWRDFEREGLGPNNVEWAFPKNSGSIRLDSDPRAWPVRTGAWTMSF